jgi:hypothetical protein
MLDISAGQVAVIGAAWALVGAAWLLDCGCAPWIPKRFQGWRDDH